jgi:hypothetical protein
MRVLVFDQSQGTKSVTRGLHRFAHRLTCVPSAESAVEALNGEKVGLIIASKDTEEPQISQFHKLIQKAQLSFIPIVRLRDIC